jgi:hypothetical protein
MTLMAFADAGSTIWHMRDNNEASTQFAATFQARRNTEIARLLISLAATLRAKVDDGTWGCSDETVGMINREGRLGSQSDEPLKVREACNKIIHATRVKPEYSGPHVKDLGIAIYLHGEHKREHWAAVIGVQAFCIAVGDTDFNHRK